MALDRQGGNRVTLDANIPWIRSPLGQTWCAHSAEAEEERRWTEGGWKMKRILFAALLGLASCGPPPFPQGEYERSAWEPVRLERGAYSPEWVYRFEVPGGWLYWVHWGSSGNIAFVPDPEQCASM